MSEGYPLGGQFFFSNFPIILVVNCIQTILSSVRQSVFMHHNVHTES